MFKLVAFCLLIICATVQAGSIATPLLAKLVPQPEAPANTEHATQVAASIPVVNYAPLTYTAISAPLPYASKYLAYSHPIAASNYFISY